MAERQSDKRAILFEAMAQIIVQGRVHNADEPSQEKSRYFEASQPLERTKKEAMVLQILFQHANKASSRVEIWRFYMSGNVKKESMFVQTLMRTLLLHLRLLPAYSYKTRLSSGMQAVQAGGHTGFKYEMHFEDLHSPPLTEGWRRLRLLDEQTPTSHIVFECDYVVNLEEALATPQPDIDVRYRSRSYAGSAGGVSDLATDPPAGSPGSSRAASFAGGASRSGSMDILAARERARSRTQSLRRSGLANSGSPSASSPAHSGLVAAPSTSLPYDRHHLAAHPVDIMGQSWTGPQAIPRVPSVTDFSPISGTQGIPISASNRRTSQPLRAADAYESRAMSLPTHLATQKPPNGGYPGHVAMADRELSASTRTDVDPLFEFFKQSTEDIPHSLRMGGVTPEVPEVSRVEGPAEEEELPEPPLSPPRMLRPNNFDLDEKQPDTVSVMEQQAMVGFDNLPFASQRVAPVENVEDPELFFQQPATLSMFQSTRLEESVADIDRDLRNTRNEFAMFKQVCLLSALLL
ncbi:uncharacterized protein MONBRDRAFT_23108 [Monosiga brevicollis MX1]|uniref:Autophagy-related protein 13 N-terminal domain-containing protein n=1 Tax=Monosiga brevicollis TaxID=81824 RepID=A9UR76_MONBE|nr:uncharacterized protein MONBRDRAFT_23108 [Monosiga brevicollis MX1]EDQ91874.1 predicted protein [Monosiga brevicollis MX1]|eukprot:XP_001743160.1 hypothetical protein [Monosiga brevicollis MX1]